MSLREDDSIDALFRQALQPLTEVAPPASTWRRIIHTIPRATPWSRWSRMTAWARGFANVFYLPVLSNQSTYVEPGGKYHPVLPVGLMDKQMLDLRLAF